MRLSFSRILFWVLCFPVFAFAQTGSFDTRYYTGHGVDTKVNCGVVLPDSGVVIGGAFTFVNSKPVNRIVKLTKDGEIDNTFNVGTGFNDQVNVIVQQADGKLIVGGDFTSYNGSSAGRIVRLNTDGSRDTTFNSSTGCNHNVYDIQLLNDGKMMVAGLFYGYNGATVSRIVRLNGNGSRDTGFSTATINNSVLSIDTLSNGKYVIGGEFTTIGSRTAQRVALLNTNGTQDTSFNSVTGANNIVNEVIVLGNDKIIASGYLTTYKSVTVNRITLLNTDGSRDTTFASGTGFGGNQVNEMIQQADGKLLAIGHFTSYNGTTINRIVRMDTTGVRDTTFAPGTGLDFSSNTVFVNHDGKIYVGGTFISVNGVNRLSFARLNTNGSLDANYFANSKMSGNIYAAGTQSTGKTIVAGNFLLYNNDTIKDIVRLTASGQRDMSFACTLGSNSAINCIAIQSDDKILLGGTFTTIDGNTANRIVRLNADGSIDTTFNPGSGFNNTVEAIAIGDTGKIYVGGSFTYFNGSAQNKIVRLNSNGSKDSGFNIGMGFNQPVMALAIQPDEKLLVGGGFSTFNGASRRMMVRLLTTGAVDTSFHNSSNADYAVYSIALRADGKMYVGGMLSRYDNTRYGVARLNSNGTLDTAFNASLPGSNITVNSLAMDGDKVVIAGEFIKAGGYDQIHIAVLDTNGSPLTTLIPDGSGLYRTAAAEGNMVYKDPITNRILIGGLFSSIKGNLAVNFGAFIGSPEGTAIDSVYTHAHICAGGSGKVYFKNRSVFNEGNIYTAELSDSSGSFASPVSIGSKEATGAIGWDSVSITIPGNTLPSSHYKVRIKATNPVYTSAGSSYFTVAPVGVPTNFSNQSICSDTAYTFVWDSVVAGDGGNQIEWSWVSDFDTSVTISSGGSIAWQVASGGTDTLWLRSKNSATGCVSDSIVVTATANAYPQIPTVYYDSLVKRQTPTQIVLIPAESPVRYSLWKDTLLVSEAISLNDTVSFNIDSIVGSTTFEIYAEDTITGCSRLLFDSINIRPSDPLTFKVHAQSAYCYDSSEAFLEIVGGIPPFSIHWSTGDSASTVSLQAGIYSVTVSDKAGDSVAHSFQISYAFIWDTLRKFTLDTAGTLTSDSPSYVFDCYAGALNSLKPGTDGWIQWNLAEGDTFSGLLGIGNNGYFDETSYGIGVDLLEDSIQFVGQGFRISTGPYNKGSKYEFVLSFEGDSVHIQQLDSTGLTFNTSLYLTRSEYLTPGVVAISPHSRLAAPFASFGCSQTKMNVKVEPAPNHYSTGSAEISLRGGIPPYHVLWSTGDTALGIYDVTPGMYSVTATDAGQDSSVLSVFVGSYVNWYVMNNVEEDSTHALFALSGWVDGEVPADLLPSAAVGANEIWVDSSGVISFDFLDGGAFSGQVGLVEDPSSEREGDPKAIMFILIPESLSLENSGIYTGNWDYMGSLMEHVSLNLKIIRTKDTCLLVKNDIAYVEFPEDGFNSFTAQPIVGPVFRDGDKIDRVMVDFGAPLKVISAIEHTTCSDSSGSLQVFPVGGHPPYEFYWNTSDTSASLVSQPVGEYSYTVTDFVGDSVRGMLTVGYKTLWDTLSGFTVDTLFGLVVTEQSEELEGSNSMAIGVNSLESSESGWIEFTIEKGDTFIGLLGLSSYEALDENTEGAAILLTGEDMYLIAFDTDYFESLGGYAPGDAYLLRVYFGDDSVEVRKYHLVNNVRLFYGSLKFPYPRSKTLYPSVGYGSPLNGRISSVVSSFGCEKVKLSVTTKHAENIHSSGSLYSRAIGGQAPLRYFWSTGDTSQNLENVPLGEYSLLVVDQNNDSAYWSGTVLAKVNWEYIADMVVDTAIDVVHSISDIEDSTQFGFAYAYNSLQVDSTGYVVFDFPTNNNFFGAVGLVSTLENLFDGGAASGIVFMILPVEEENSEKAVYLLQHGAPEDGVFLGNYDASLPMRLAIKVIGDTAYLYKNNVLAHSLHHERNHALRPIVLGFPDFGGYSFSAHVDFGVPLQAITIATPTQCGDYTGSVIIQPIGGQQPYIVAWEDNGDTTVYRDSLMAGIYTVIIIDSIGDSVSVNIEVPYDVVWDSLYYTAIDSDGLHLNGGVSVGDYKSFAAGLNTIMPEEDGWLEWTWTPDSLFKGIIGFANNLLFDETSEIVGFKVNDSGFLFSYFSDLGEEQGEFPDYPVKLKMKFDGDSIELIAYDLKHGIFNTDKIPYSRNMPMFPFVASDTFTVLSNLPVTGIGCDRMRINATVSHAQSFYDTGQASVMVRGGTPPYKFTWSTGDTTDIISAPVGTYQLTVTDAIPDTIRQNVFIGCFPDWEVLYRCRFEEGEMYDSIPANGEAGSFALSYNTLSSDSNGVASFDFVKAGKFEGYVGFSNSIDLESSSTHAVGIGLLPPTPEEQPGTKSIYAASTFFDPIFLGYTRDSVPLNLKLKKVANIIYLVKNDFIEIPIYFDSLPDFHLFMFGMVEDFSITGITCDFNSPLTVKGNVTHNGCDTLLSSLINASALGGKPPYTYHWSSSDTLATISGLSSGNYTLTVVDALLDTSQATFTVGHEIWWDTLIYATSDTNGVLTFVVPDTALGVAYSVNSLAPSGDGWVSFTVVVNEFTKGNCGLLDNLVEEDGMNLAFLEIDSSGDVYVHESTESRESYFGRCSLDFPYEFRFKFVDDSLFVTKQNQFIEEDYGELSFYFPRTFTLSPFVSTPSDTAVFRNLHSSFGCNESPCPVPPNPGNIYATSDTICLGDGLYLSVDSSGFSTEWFLNSCGGSAVGSSSEMFFRSDTSVTIYVRNRNYCLLSADSSIVYDYISDSCSTIRIVVQDSSTCDTRNFALLQFEEGLAERANLAVASSFKFSVADYSYLEEDSIGLRYRVLAKDTTIEVVSAREVGYSNDGHYLIEGLSVLSIGTTYRLEFILNNGNRYTYYIFRN